MSIGYDIRLASGGPFVCRAINNSLTKTHFNEFLIALFSHLQKKTCIVRKLDRKKRSLDPKLN